MPAKRDRMVPGALLIPFQEQAAVVTVISQLGQVLQAIPQVPWSTAVPRKSRMRTGASSDKAWEGMFYSSSQAMRKSFISTNSLGTQEVFILLLWRWLRVIY